jgi:putative salt-induced outer membrane protein YdiY
MGKMIAKMIFCGFVFLWGFALVADGASADEVILVNGDKMTGTVVKVEGGKLTIKTEYADAVEIQAEKIKSIITDNPAEVHLLGGEVLKGKIRTTEDGKLAVEASPERAAATVEMSKVTAINPPPKPPAKLTGNITLGGAYQSGNTKRRNFSVAADASIKGERDRFGIRFLFNYADEKEEVTARNIYGSLKYDYFFTKRFYGYLGLEMQKDRFKDLNLRTIVGPGVGYQVWDDPVKFLLFEAGLAYYSEDRRVAEDDSWVAARLAAAFRYTLSKYLTFSDRLEIYPSLANSNDFTLRNEAAILSPIGAGWSLKLANILEYDNDPPVNVSKTDVTWILGLQYSF